jgi:hypothetical protein
MKFINLTSSKFLWYLEQGQLPFPSQTHVDANVIEGRYTSLEPFCFQWRETYESAFKGQECHRQWQRDFPENV